MNVNDNDSALCHSSDQLLDQETENWKKIPISFFYQSVYVISNNDDNRNYKNTLIEYNQNWIRKNVKHLKCLRTLETVRLIIVLRICKPIRFVLSSPRLRLGIAQLPFKCHIQQFEINRKTKNLLKHLHLHIEVTLSHVLSEINIDCNCDFEFQSLAWTKQR